MSTARVATTTVRHCGSILSFHRTRGPAIPRPVQGRRNRTRVPAVVGADRALLKNWSLRPWTRWACSTDIGATLKDSSAWVVLMYHQVIDDPSLDPFSTGIAETNTRNFDQHLRFLRERFEVLPVSEVARSARPLGEALPQPDCFRDVRRRIPGQPLARQADSRPACSLPWSMYFPQEVWKTASRCGGPRGVEVLNRWPDDTLELGPVRYEREDPRVRAAQRPQHRDRLSPADLLWRLL